MIERIPKERWNEIDFSVFGESAMPEGEIFAYTEDGKILGWYLREPVIHAGPFWVDPSRRGGVIAGELARHAFETIPRMYVAALNPNTVSICEKFGLTEVDGTLYLKEY